MIGPIQLIAIGFESNENFRGDILGELNEVRARGVIKLLDLLFVMKHQDGEVSALEMSDLTAEEEIEYGALIGGLMGMGAEGAEGAAAGMEAGALAAAENSFGICKKITSTFKQQVQGIGGRWCSSIEESAYEIVSANDQNLC